MLGSFLTLTFDAALLTRSQMVLETKARKKSRRPSIPGASIRDNTLTSDQQWIVVGRPRELCGGNPEKGGLLLGRR